jgi:cellulose synthase/poly-beta-1,6-N-acetylglucosamine synthase-like glycosyltransferase
MNFTYIIPFKYTDDRFYTLQKVINNIKDLNCEVIVIEQGIESILPNKNLLTTQKYLFLNNPYPFNKSWALNVAWKEATNDIIIFGDADNIIDIYHILSAVKEMNDYEFISPHIKLVDLQPSENNLDNNSIFRINRPGRGELDHQKLPMCGAMTIFRKDALDKIGGWPEEFFGWGAEDDAMSIKVKHFLKWKEIDNNCYHLYHQRVNPDMQWYQRNIQIYQNYINAPKDKLKEYIDSTRKIIGDKNRKFI